MREQPLQKTDYWTRPWRAAVFILAFSSIACLLSDFYQLCPMRSFTLFIFLPCCLALLGFATWDSLNGNRQLWRAVMLGIFSGLLAAAAYDIFRLPFVFAKPLGITSVLPELNLFKVFPRFGAMILDQPLEQVSYSFSAHLIGWIYHLGNGATFGVMYVALLGNGSQRTWAWGVLMAAGLEAGMLLTPYPQYFGIAVTATFVCVTLAAHMIFGGTMGLVVQRWMRARWSGECCAS